MSKHFLFYLGIVLIISLLVSVGCAPITNGNKDISGLPPVGQIQNGENDIPTSETMTKEEGQEIALEFVENSPTFKFDGIEDTLELVNSIEISIPGAWTYELYFESRHAGFGDRVDQILAQLITPHSVSVSVEQGEVVYASMDNQWDMLSQEEYSDDIDPVIPDIKDTTVENMSWILVSFERQGDPVAMPDGIEVTLFFDKSEGLAQGQSGWNSYGGAYRIDGHNLAIPEVESTEMACLEPEGVMELEQQYLRSIIDVQSYEINSGMLTLYTTNETLLFRADGEIPPQAKGVSIELSCDAFETTPHISLSMAPEIAVDETISVWLCSNPTTGFAWSEFADIRDTTILQQVSHEYIEPEAENTFGGSGVEVWVFQGIQQGMTSITLEYRRPWGDTEEAEWIFDLTVNVK